MKLSLEEKEFLESHLPNCTLADILNALNKLRKIKNEPVIGKNQLAMVAKRMRKQDTSRRASLEEETPTPELPKLPPKKRGLKIGNARRNRAREEAQRLQQDSLAPDPELMESPVDKDLCVESRILYYEDLRIDS